MRNCHRVRPKSPLQSWSTAAAALRGDLDLGEVSRGVAARTAAPPGFEQYRFSATRCLFGTTVNRHLASSPLRPPKWIVPELHRQVDGNVAREPNGRVTGKF